MSRFVWDRMSSQSRPFSSTLLDRVVGDLLQADPQQPGRLHDLGIMSRKFGSEIPSPCRRARSSSSARRPDADQRVAAPDGVVEEGERPVLAQRHQPERELGHLDGQRVLVHAVQAPLGHQSAGVGQPLVRVLGDQLLVRRPGRGRPLGRDPRQAGAASRRPPTPRPAGPPGNGTPGRGTPRSRTPCRRSSARAVPWPAAASTPPWASPRPGRRDERLQRVLDDRLGQAAGRVVRAAGPAIGPRRDEHRRPSDHHRLVERVVADQPRERPHPADSPSSPHAAGASGGLPVDRGFQGLPEGASDRPVTSLSRGT